MITEQLALEVNNQKVDVVFKDIKNLHLAVYPPNGRVRVAAPLRLDVEAVRLAVISRLGWIRRQQARFQVQERQSEREFVTGETHYFRGRRYRLRVVESDDQLIRRSGNATLELQVRKETSKQRREAIVSGWHRCELSLLVPRNVPAGPFDGIWLLLYDIDGDHVGKVVIRRTGCTAGVAALFVASVLAFVLLWRLFWSNRRPRHHDPIDHLDKL